MHRFVPYVVECALCARKIEENEICHVIPIASMWDRYICGWCWDKVRDYCKKYEEGHPENVANIEITNNPDGTCSWRWIGELWWPLKVNNFIIMTRPELIKDNPFGLVRIDVDAQWEDVSYFRRTK